MVVENPETAPVEVLRADLRERFGEMPIYKWRKISPDLTLQVGYQEMESPLLPAGIPYGSHEFDGYGNNLDAPHVVGNDLIEHFFARNGRLFTRLVHYARDGYDSDKAEPDEVLGEITDEGIYREAYVQAIEELQMYEELFERAEQEVTP